jgi:hypothetical protein
LGLLEHPAPNVEPGDVVVLADGRDAVVTARVEAEPGWGQLVAMLEARSPHLGSMPTTRSRSWPRDVSGASDDPGSRATCGSRSASLEAGGLNQGRPPG